jgi:hypothetical protein
LQTNTMIEFAVLAGLLCGAYVVFESWRRPGDPYATMRIPVAGAWAATWLLYGLNAAQFPTPDTWTLFVLAVTCLGSLLMCPTRQQFARVTGASVPWVQSLLLWIAIIVTAKDVYFAALDMATFGVTAGLGQFRVDRMLKVGAYAMPGMEILHAAIAAIGALGFAEWRLTRRTVPLIAAVCGLISTLVSTGRWEVVAYVVWLVAIEAFLSRRIGYRTLAMQGVVYVALGVFFVSYGQLLGKVDAATILANSSADERVDLAGNEVPTVFSTGLRSGVVRSRSRSLIRHTPVRSCPRWTVGVQRANDAFRSMPSVARVVVLYFAGPLASLDRALCEGDMAQRVVLMYWPNKLARIVGLRAPEELLVVDPFTDIGIPFNNYTVIYPFLSEVGPRAGLIAWLIFALLIQRLSGVALRMNTLGGVIAGTAPLAMAIRTPWTNTFLDGTLVVWVIVALAPTVVDRVYRSWAHQAGQIAQPG